MDQGLQQIRSQIFFTDILNLSAPLARVRRYTISMLIHSASAPTARHNTIKKHFPNACTALSDLPCEAMHAFREMGRK